MYDVFLLSYHEPFAEESYELLLDVATHAQHVKNIKGIFNAHKRCAELSKTKMFYVVDADARLVEGFDFSYEPKDADEIYKGVPATKCVHVWRSKNPINELIYGYGGVKLFPTVELKEAKDWHIDFTTSVGGNFVAVKEVSNITAFNTDEWSTWKSAFRECAKLASSVIKNAHADTEHRLNVWCEVGEVQPYGKFAIEGARAGRDYGKKYSGDSKALDKINDFEWLKEKFNECR